MINPQIIDRIFEVAAIEEVVGEYVKLKKAGANYRGLCPFHDDKNPSMSVSPAKGIFKCFSCGQGGNVIHFVMEHEGLSYPLAIKHLAEKYNIPFEEGEIDLGALEEESRKKDGLYAVLEFARKFFHEQLLNSQDGRVIYKPYLAERGIREDTVVKFGLGLSPKEKTSLLDAALRNGYSAQQLYDAGLVKKVDENMGVIESNLRDTFIDRVMYPIQNISSKVLGFGGRTIRKDTKAPKYINSPETIIYEKRKVLYGLNFAKNEIRKQDRVYLVEGYMDVISLSQAGIENVVAVSGTAFTEEQARIIKRFTPEAILLFDGDEAGVNASLKHINTLLSFDINPRVALFPEGEDPDSFVQKHGKEAFEKFVHDKAQDFVHFMAEVKLKEKKDDPIAKAEAARMITESISQVPDPLKRAAYVNEAAKILEWQERVLIEETNKHRVKKLRNEDLPPLQPLHIEEEIQPDERIYQEYEILKSLILHGSKSFNDEMNVAGFVFNELIQEELWPETPEINEILREALEYFNEHQSLSEEYFIRNPLSSRMAADYISGQHVLSDGWMTHYSKKVPSGDDLYKKHVVENLNYLKLRKIQLAIDENLESMKMANTAEEIQDIQLKDIKLKELKRKITDEIGAVILR